MNTKCSEELQSRQKYRNKLVSELSVTVTCSRVPFLDPVLVKPRSSTIVPPKCIQSQNLSLNTSPAAKHTMKNRSRCQVQRPDALVTHARPCTPRHLVSPPGFQLFPSAWNSPMQLWGEMMQGSQSVFSLSKTISSGPPFFHVLRKFIIQVPNCAGHWYAEIVQITKEIPQRLLTTS